MQVQVLLSAPSFPKENGESATGTQHSPNISQEVEGESERDVKFPLRLRHNRKGRVWATIYSRPNAFRLYWRTKVDGKPVSRMQDFTKFSEAKRAGVAKVAELAKGVDQKLTPGQSSDAIAALEGLQEFYQKTGQRLSLRAAVADCCAAALKLKPSGRTLGDAVDGFLTTVAGVKRQDIKEAVEQFLALEEPRTKIIVDGKPDISPKYHGHRAIMLRRFAGMFPNTCVCDLTKQHVDTFFSSLDKLPSKSRNRRGVSSAKTRNHYRAAISQFMEWATTEEYLMANHRLGEAKGMSPQKGNTAPTEVYLPAEFRALLESADETMRPLVAIGGLAGLRTVELLRLDWADVWRVRGHIEVTKAKSKTRQRRLVETCKALSAWLAPYRLHKEGKLWPFHEITFQERFVRLCELAKVTRKRNGLRHGFCSYHFALHANENLSAAMAGHSPQMLHQNYKGLATRKEAQGWFGTKPAKTKTAANIIQLVGSSRL